MIKYVIEVGLDAIATPQADGTYPTLTSLVLVDEPDGAGSGSIVGPAWLAMLDYNIPFVVRVYDYSPSGHGFPLEPIGIVATILFSANPFADIDPLSVVPIYRGDRTESPIICGRQELFHPDRPSYLRRSLNPECWGLRHGDEEAMFKFPDSTDIRAVLDLKIFVLNQIKTQTLKNPQFRIYSHDPEIFVGVGGPPPGGDPEAREKNG